MQHIRIICRDSRLSLLQAELVKQKIVSCTTGIEVDIVGRTSRGDMERSVPLSSLDGTDFFTEDIFVALMKGEAELAVHSLKDMSAPHFFSHSAFAIVDRDDKRDVAIFNPGIIEKIQQGKTITIGTCSPRREEMATEFLKKALPHTDTEIEVEVKSIRGNVESRLQQLDQSAYDGTILATAGLNRLLRSENASLIHSLLRGKKIMFLPLIECVPAPCQGAIVVEANPDNTAMVALINLINSEELFQEASAEKKEAYKYGTGSLQSFGVTSFTHAGGKWMYAAGRDAKGNAFKKWHGLPQIEVDDKNVFSTTDYMGQLFKYEHYTKVATINEPVVFISNYKAIHDEQLAGLISSKRVWASGTKTWLQLAQKGIWIEGCADSFGLESLESIWSQPMINLAKDEIHIISNTAGAAHWQAKGWKASGTYSFSSHRNPIIQREICEAHIIFWTSIHLYLEYKDLLREDVIHLTSSGETATLLRSHGIAPIIFPTIKSFEQWRTSNIRPLIVA